jgi:hypothetical protein
LPLLWFPGWTGSAVWVGGIILGSVTGLSFDNILGPIDGIRLALKTQRVNDVWGEIATRSDMLRQAIANQKALPLFSRKTGA